jgi:sugar fermentation stimulation protein A
VKTYPFPPLLSGILVQRYKRFFADITLDTGETVVAHCPNTGPMTGIYRPGNRVWVSPNDDPKRKLKYTWELIELQEEGAEQPVLVGVNTALPNRVIRRALEQHWLPEMGEYGTVQPEVKYGQDGGSRIDFLLKGEGKPTYVEVKNTTWTAGSLALFPDTVTTRGQKHLREMTLLVPQERAVMLYFINRSDCEAFSPGDERDPEYGRLLRSAVAAGVEVLPCRFAVSTAGVEYLGLAELRL